MMLAAGGAQMNPVAVYSDLVERPNLDVETADCWRSRTPSSMLRTPVTFPFVITYPPDVAE